MVFQFELERIGSHFLSHDLDSTGRFCYQSLLISTDLQNTLAPVLKPGAMSELCRGVGKYKRLDFDPPPLGRVLVHFHVLNSESFSYIRLRNGVTEKMIDRSNVSVGNTTGTCLHSSFPNKLLILSSFSCSESQSCIRS